jgi:hypothetical protein
MLRRLVMCELGRLFELSCTGHAWVRFGVGCFGSYTCVWQLYLCLAVTPVAPTPQERSAPGAGPLTVRKPACFNS